ncbi:MAG: PQQ-binding-like beta-propeller repeat protein [Proteobacteria bacterium]|nr:PQQ-binding-like beta-propeller repeat protein [Pseudomonadota bacterium]
MNHTSRNWLASGLMLAGCMPWAVQAQEPAAASASVPASAQAPAPANDEARLSGGRPDLFAPPPAKKLYEQHCASCHTDAGIQLDGRVIPTTATLKAMQASRLYDVMATGKMMSQAAGISDRDMRGIAEMITGKKIEGSNDTLISAMKNNCATNPPLSDPASSPAWDGWSPAPDNARHQGARAARLGVADVPRLKLKWAFGLPLGASSSSQPSVVSGRVFVGSDNSTLYSLDAKTGCAYWSFRTRSPGRAAPIVAPIRGFAGVKYAVYYITGGRNLYALDARTGKQLWESTVPGEGNGVSGSPSYYQGRLYVPLTASGVTAGFTPNIECCKVRGAVAAVDASNGKIIWRTETVPEPLEKISRNSIGTQVWGPAGASVWNSPTIDPKRGLIYVGTGNSYGPRVASTSDSIVALSMKDGSIQWHHQEFQDAFMLGCPPTSQPDEICPPKLGEDWDFGGASAILQSLGAGRSVLVAAGKGGVAIALDPDQKGKLLWREKLYDHTPPTADGLVVFGGTADGKRVYWPLQQEGGGLKAQRLKDGHIDWNADIRADKRGQAGAASSIPGVVFTGGWDGVLRAVDMNGRVIWSFNTRQRFESVNGVIAIGGSLGAPGPTIANGMVYVASGYPGFQNGTPGNVVLAFGVD